MKQEALISVLMPVYNGEEFLAEAISSILNQSYSKLELIICDDASTDQSKKIIQSYSDLRIVFIENKENKGIVYTRNKLFKEAKGDYWALLDCDDVSLKERLKKQLSYLQNNPDYSLCGTWAKQIDSHRNITGHIQMPTKHDEIKANLLFQSSFVQSTVMFRAATMKGIEYDSSYSVSEDFDLWSRLAMHHKIANLADYLVLYRWHNLNITQTKTDLIKKNTLKIIERNFKHYLNKEVSSKELLIQHQVGSLLKSDAISEKKDWIKELMQLEMLNINTNIFKAIIMYRWFFWCYVNNKLEKAFLPIFYYFKPITTFTFIKLTGRKIRSLLINN